MPVLINVNDLQCEWIEMATCTNMQRPISTVKDHGASVGGEVGREMIVAVVPNANNWIAIEQLWKSGGI